MKEFNTITELELLNAAYAYILAKWDHEIEVNQRALKERGCENKTAVHRAEKYWVQLEELLEHICALEK